MLETVKTLDNDEVDLIRPRRTANPENVKRVEFILSEENFDELFPRRHSSYTYTRLLQVSRNQKPFWGIKLNFVCRPLESSRPSVVTSAVRPSLTISAAGLSQPCSLTSLRKPEVNIQQLTRLGYIHYTYQIMMRQ